NRRDVDLGRRRRGDRDAAAVPRALGEHLEEALDRCDVRVGLRYEQWAIAQLDEHVRTGHAPHLDLRTLARCDGDIAGNDPDRDVRDVGEIGLELIGNDPALHWRTPP